MLIRGVIGFEAINQRKPRTFTTGYACALLVAARHNDAALEQMIGRMSLEPYVTAVHWQAQQAAAES